MCDHPPPQITFLLPRPPSDSPAHHPCIVDVPVVVAHSPPQTLHLHLHTSLCPPYGPSTAHQSDALYPCNVVAIGWGLVHGNNADHVNIMPNEKGPYSARIVTYTKLSLCTVQGCNQLHILAIISDPSFHNYQQVQLYTVHCLEGTEM